MSLSISGENIKWLRDTKNSSISLTSSWVKVATLKTMENESKFCDNDILRQVLKAKSMFDKIDSNTFIKARSTCNPFETIGRSIFQNRSAVKMANLDALLGFVLTKPAPDLTYFADLCGGPGGFSEYILWRTQKQIKGFGFTLRGKNDFKLSESLNVFDRYYGAKNDGNILDPDNIFSLKEYILQATYGARVDFVMVDGGMNVDDENMQEIILKQLILCQCLVSLAIVRDGGNAIIKLFDCFTMFTVGLVFLMYKSFREICIVKPNSSRPANSERYLICRFKRSSDDDIEQYLNCINLQMWYGNPEVVELIPFEVLSQDKSFIKYIKDSNSSIGRNQIISLKNIFQLIKTGRTQAVQAIHTESKTRCLLAWNLPMHQQEKVNLHPVVKSNKIQSQQILIPCDSVRRVSEKPALSKFFSLHCEVLIEQQF